MYYQYIVLWSDSYKCLTTFLSQSFFSIFWKVFLSTCFNVLFIKKKVQGVSDMHSNWICRKLVHMCFYTSPASCFSRSTSCEVFLSILQIVSFRQHSIFSVINRFLFNQVTLDFFFFFNQETATYTDCVVVVKDFIYPTRKKNTTMKFCSPDIACTFFCTV